MPEERLQRSMLLDFYGEMLTARQRECYELHFNEDLSLSEIAEQCGISRQGAWDNIRRASDTLEEMEKKTGLIQRTLSSRKHLQHLADLLGLLEAQLSGAGNSSPDYCTGRHGDSGETNGACRVSATGLLQAARDEVRAMLNEED